MADTTTTLIPGDWVKVNATASAEISAQNASGLVVRFKGTVDDVKPAVSSGSFHIKPYGGISSDEFQVYFPSAQYLWVFSDGYGLIEATYV